MAVDRGVLKDPKTYAAASSECDVVMKGGITSGVLYPLAICELARERRLRNVGGSSAGAIAAAAAAAAEVGRDRDGAGFARLAGLPEALAAPVEGRSKLFSLFRPNKGTRGLFDLLVAFLFPPRGKVDLMDELSACGDAPEGRIACAAKALGRWTTSKLAFLRVPVAFALAFGTVTFWSAVVAVFAMIGLEGLALAGAFPTGLPGAALGIVLTVPLWIVVQAGLLLLTAPKAVSKTIADNGYGLATGFVEPDGTDRETLSAWLADELDALAGKEGSPLTFGDLEDAGVNLEVLTTNLTHGRPYRIPFGERIFRFSEEELARYFPPRIVRWMVEHPWDGDGDGEPEVVVGEDGLALRRLPATRDLPVVFAARLSLSFPILISAVPLYARRFGGESDGWTRTWFSDGGICSNLPVHFFDSPLPGHPTFAINLRSTSELRDDPADNVRLPENNLQGIQPSWRSIGDVLGFLKSVVDTMQNWTDDALLRTPGYRDRVATIYHTEEEGGMNLDMPATRISRLAERGACAGDKLRDDFDWGNHRWVRFRSSMYLHQRMTHRIASRLGPDIDAGIEESASYPIDSKTQRQVAKKVIDEVEKLGAHWSEDDNPFGEQHAEDAPRPTPALRISPDV